MASRINRRRLHKTVFSLLESGRSDEARKLVRRLLRERSPGQPGDRGTLLYFLFEIETYSDRYVEALALLSRRRSLGFRTSGERFNATLLAARLLMKTSQWFAARTELTGLLTDHKCISWPGILQALDAYVAADGRCREEMNQVLREGCEAAKARFGINLEGTEENQDASETIRRMHSLFRDSSKAFQELECGLLLSVTERQRDEFVGQLRERARSERVGFIRDQMESLLRRFEEKRD